MTEYLGINRIERNFNRYGEQSMRIVTEWPDGSYTYPRHDFRPPTIYGHWAVVHYNVSKTRSYHVDVVATVYDAAKMNKPDETITLKYRKNHRIASNQAEHDVSKTLYERGFRKILDWEDVKEWQK
ncbi:hypothetical protein HUG15_00345 [Salicibibacter cibarius]|uniref:Uncharacterized protein n=1 Tax=Salicibibacter cibarius TaxID=2743000 RepID=A0A7T6YZK4_9BACI|nr:hypothetical protein [Salicibibacter cibarius]QQK74218.1 hypothetical protein HUG15_00345 [Salicibibacter cibarius]